jgi:hypothetical protein
MPLRLRHSSILSGIELTNVLISSISIPSQRSRIKLFTPSMSRPLLVLRACLSRCFNIRHTFSMMLRSGDLGELAYHGIPILALYLATMLVEVFVPCEPSLSSRSMKDWCLSLASCHACSLYGLKIFVRYCSIVILPASLGLR